MTLLDMMQPVTGGEPAAGTQNARLLEYLRGGRSIDPLVSWTQLGIYRLGARVFDLRKAGHNIISERKDVRNRFGETARVATYRMGK